MNEHFVTANSYQYKMVQGKGKKISIEKIRFTYVYQHLNQTNSELLWRLVIINCDKVPLVAPIDTTKTSSELHASV